MSNKTTIKRTAKPAEKMAKKEKKPSILKSRRKLAGMIPAIVFMVVAIWYLLSSRQ